MRAFYEQFFFYKIASLVIEIKFCTFIKLFGRDFNALLARTAYHFEIVQFKSLKKYYISITKEEQ